MKAARGKLLGPAKNVDDALPAKSSSTIFADLDPEIFVISAA